MSGLQGSGKTTACAKLAKLLRKDNKDVAIAACDLQRPAAVEQLQRVGAQAKAHVYAQEGETDPVKVAKWALDEAKREDRDVLIVDTAGRLHVDEELMAELAAGAQGDQAPQRAARARRDDRPGRRQRRRGLRRDRGVRRRR